MNRINRYIQTLRLPVLLLFLLGMTAGVSAQQHPERKMIRSGNKNFNKGSYEEAELDYLKARHANPGYYEAAFNLFDNYYMQGRYEDAERGFEEISESMYFMDEKELSEIYFNKGNSLFRQEKYEEALEAFRSAMRYDPDDEEAKFNYAYTKKMLEDDNQDDNQDDENDDDSDGEGDDQQDNSDGNNDDNNNDQDNSDNDNNDQNRDNDQQEQPQSGMNRDDAEQMLEAIQNSEDNTSEKMDAEEQPAAALSGKNW